MSASPDPCGINLGHQYVFGVQSTASWVFYLVYGLYKIHSPLHFFKDTNVIMTHSF